MIVIEVEAPMLGRFYDFQIDENVPVNEIIIDISDLICRREQCAMLGDEKELMLWDLHTCRQLDHGKTAVENGLQTGSRIMII